LYWRGKLRNFEFYLPTKVYFGQKVVENVGSETKKLGKKVLIVTGKSSARKTGILQKVENSLKRAKIKTVLFEGVEANPSIETINKGTKLAKEEKCEVIVGLGGGSPLDAAKGIAILSTNSGSLSDYFGRNKIKEIPLSVVAIPTTAGTGSEVTPYAVFTHKENLHPRKKIIADISLFPRVALVDPELTLSLPASITADTGIDAFSHALESYLSNRSRPLSDIMASEAITLLFNYLPKVKKNLEEINIRSHILYASLLAGMAIAQSGTILVHAMSYRLTTDLGLSHGKACALLLPSVCEFSLSQGHPKLALLGKCLGENMEGVTIKKAVEKVIARIKNLIYQLELVKDLKIEKIKKQTIEDFAREIMQNKRKLASNPRQATFKDVIEMYKKALSS